MKTTWDEPHNEQRQAFNALKKSIVEPPVLALPVENRPFLPDTDSLVYQIAVKCLQQQDDDTPKSWATIGYWSRSLSDVDVVQ